MCSHAKHCLQRTQLKAAAISIIELVATAGYHTHPQQVLILASTTTTTTTTTTMTLLHWFLTVSRK